MDPVDIANEAGVLENEAGVFTIAAPKDLIEHKPAREIVMTEGESSVIEEDKTQRK